MSEYIYSFDGVTEQGIETYMRREKIVRCRDCKYYLHSNEKCELLDTRLHFYVTYKIWSEDAFCKWGERRNSDD